MKEQRFEKVVKWKDSNQILDFGTDLDFFIIGTLAFFVVWITSIVWVPVWFFYKLKESWKEDRKVYFKKLKGGKQNGKTSRF